MIKTTILFFIFLATVNATNIGLQYEYKRFNSIGIVIETQKIYSACINGVFSIKENDKQLGIELSNSFRIFQRKMIGSSIIFDTGILWRKETSDVPINNVEIVRTLINLDLLHKLSYAPIDLFSIYTKIGLGYNYSFRPEHTFSLLPAIGIRILIPSKDKRDNKRTLSNHNEKETDKFN